MMGFCGSGLGGMHGGGLGTLGMVLGIALFLGLGLIVVLGAVLLVRRFSRQPVSPRAGEDPLEIARRRLAAGEITVADFEQLRKTLRG